MQQRPVHQAQVRATPWAGVHSTHIHSGLHFGRHSHDTHGVGVMEQGAHASASGRGTVRAYAGDLITSNPGEVHDGRPLEGPARRWRMLYFEPQFMATWLQPGDAPRPATAGPASLASRSGATPELVRPVITDPALHQQFLGLVNRIDHWATGPCATRLMACDEALAQILQSLAARHTTLAPPPSAAPAAAAAACIGAARERLAEELLQPPDLATLAAQCGLSRYQFLRRFKAAYGLPPHAWLLQRRAEKARQLLRHGASLAATATDCGYADQSHLQRHFVHQFGYTPGAWRQAMGRRTGAANHAAAQA